MVDITNRKRRLNAGLLSQQQKMREQTYHKIREAAQLLMEEGRDITRSELNRETGLANSTFSKDHVKQFLLEEYGIGVKKPLLPVGVGNGEDSKGYNLLLKLYEKNQSLLEKANKKLRKEGRLRNEAERKVEEMNHEIKVLRGELDIASRKIVLLMGNPKLKDKKKLLQLLRGGDESLDTV